MKFLFVARNPSIFVQNERAIRLLVERGHFVKMLLCSPVWRNAAMDAQRLTAYREITGGAFDYAFAPQPSGLAAAVLKHTRELVNLMAYLRPRNPVSTSPYMVARAGQALYSPLDFIARIRPVRLMLRCWALARPLRLLDALLPPNGRVMDALRAEKADLLIASPFIFSRSPETEFVKCARRLGLRSAVAVFSWDNLTSKGVFQIVPDAVLVWNRAQVQELEAIHGVPGEKAIPTGAPSLDFWFEKQPSVDRDGFCRRHGLPPGRPFLVYLCSSQTIAPDEHVFVREFVRALRARMGEAAPSVLIRPHPLNLAIWNGFEEPGAAIVPRANQDIFYSDEARQLFFDTLKHGIGVVGLNTTAMIEASILDCPCLSMLVPRYASTQEQSGHFHHLTDSGLVYPAEDFDGLARVLAVLMAGRDPRAGARRAFVRDFVRPYGVHHPSGRLTADAWERLAAGDSPASVAARLAALEPALDASGGEIPACAG